MSEQHGGKNGKRSGKNSNTSVGGSGGGASSFVPCTLGTQDRERAAQLVQQLRTGGMDNFLDVLLRSGDYKLSLGYDATNTAWRATATRNGAAFGTARSATSQRASTPEAALAALYVALVEILQHDLDFGATADDILDI